MVSTPPPSPARAATPPTPVQTDAVVAELSTDALVVDVSELSTWEQAVVAATTNDAAKLRALLAEEPGLRTLRVTAEDVSHLSSTSGVHVTQGRLLIECALERDHEDVVMLCLEEEVRVRVRVRARVRVRVRVTVRARVRIRVRVRVRARAFIPFFSFPTRRHP